jgi:hypothetical protein
MHTLTLLTAAALALLPPPHPGSSTATVALVADLPAAGARAAVIRRAAGGDVILLARGTATTDDLAAALALLAAARTGDAANRPARDEVLVVKSSRLSRPLDAPRRLRLDAYLARLRAAAPRRVEGVGTVPTIEVSVRARPRPR